MATAPVVTFLLLATPLLAITSGTSVAIDSAGNIWTTGRGVLNLTTPNAFQKSALSLPCATQQLSPFTQPTTVPCSHAYVSETDAAGKLLYASYLAGSSDDGAIAITTDIQGNAYVTGYTYSADFPVTPGAVQSKHAGPVTPKTIIDALGPFGPVEIVPGGDVFVAKFSPDGTLVYSTLLGGSGSDVPARIGVDAAGSVYIAGTTSSADFPVTAGALAHQAQSENFFARLNPLGTALVYSTYSDPTIQAFDIDDRGVAYLTGFLQPLNTDASGGPYVTAIATSAGGALYSTFLHGVDSKIAGSGAAIAVNGEGNVFVAVSPAPVPSNLLVPAPSVFALGPSFLLQLSAEGSRILTETDVASAQFDSVGTDSAGNAYAFGHGTGVLPAGPSPLLAQPCAAAGGSFVVEADPAGNVRAATYLRQGDDRAVRITAPGHILVYRSASGGTVPVDLTFEPEMNFGCLENLALGTVGLGLAPGEVFATFGYGIGPTRGVSAVPDASGQFPTSLGGVQVLIGGTPAPLLFVRAGEIHGVAPFSLPVVSTVEVHYNGASAPPLDAPWSYVNPGIFSIGGQGAIINQEGTVNTPANPAKLGSIVSIYATGTGYVVSSPLGPPGSGPGIRDGQITPLPPPYLLLVDTPQVTFAGVPGTVLWAGLAPGLIAGVTQINAQLPVTLPAGTNLAAAPVVLSWPGILSPPAPISVTK